MASRTRRTKKVAPGFLSEVEGDFFRAFFKVEVKMKSAARPELVLIAADLNAKMTQWAEKRAYHNPSCSAPSPNHRFQLDGPSRLSVHARIVHAQSPTKEI
jgi:hypothetical protein